MTQWNRPVGLAAPRLAALLSALCVVLAAWALPGCPGPANPYLPYPEPDYEQFKAVVQPILERSCSNLGCHGDANRRLTLYSVEYLRAEPAVPGTPFDPDSLEEAEKAWNYDSIRARLIDTVSADTARVLLKNLDPAAGGIVHADGEIVFFATDEPDYVALRDWIETGL